ncbi:hypothetical protein Pmani_024127 [Petrolisthes manimaculis]|uniref:Reverse transcriptase domain-containing protein n=1 Tax=Petrolisthes manimaculis TaxID=1843537 RepID=A0AAE1U0B5_9EUCA|nr:hypothetical protein Pmani_024127 [Petrolisthes manimaculis]
MQLHVSSATICPLLNTADNFVGGNIFTHRSQWRCLTSDKWILDVVVGNVLVFESLPVQSSLPRPLNLSRAHQNVLDAALQVFLKKKIIERCEAGDSPGFFSNVFPTFKIDGLARVILNLKELNNYVKYSHIKMDTIKDVIQLVHPSCYFMTVDFKDAYYSVPVRPKDREWLRFIWQNVTFQFTCLPQGLSSAPRIFTKILKPVLSHLRKLLITVSCYIDDCIFIANSDKELIDNVKYAVQLFDSVGLTVNLNKSVLVPTQKVEFLGITLNSSDMTATLPSRRRHSIKKHGNLLLKGDTSLHALAVFIGLTVASEPAVTLAPLRYKYLEIVRNKELCNWKDVEENSGERGYCDINPASLANSGLAPFSTEVVGRTSVPAPTRVPGFASHTHRQPS